MNILFKSRNFSKQRKARDYGGQTNVQDKHYIFFFLSIDLWGIDVVRADVHKAWSLLNSVGGVDQNIPSPWSLVSKTRR
jgi:hypothetical protein